MRSLEVIIAAVVIAQARTNDQSSMDNLLDQFVDQLADAVFKVSPMSLARTNLVRQPHISSGMRTALWNPTSREVARPTFVRAGTLGASSFAQPITGLKTKYHIITPGSGEEVEKGNTVTVHATGKVINADGSEKQFWSTKDKGARPLVYTAGVGMLIKGWDQGCIGMKEGEVRELDIPYEEGYGKKGFNMCGIPGESNLRFELEVVKIEKGKLDFLKFMPFPGFPGLPGLPGLVCPKLSRN